MDKEQLQLADSSRREIIVQDQTSTVGHLVPESCAAVLQPVPPVNGNVSSPRQLQHAESSQRMPPTQPVKPSPGGEDAKEIQVSGRCRFGFRRLKGPSFSTKEH